MLTLSVKTPAEVELMMNTPQPNDRTAERRPPTSELPSADIWDLELSGRPVAFLTEPQFEDVFWVSYRLVTTTDDPALAERLGSEAFWRGEDWSALEFRNRGTGLTAENAFPAIQPFVGPQRVKMRALHNVVFHPSPWETLTAKVRQLFGLAGRGAVDD